MSQSIGTIVGAPIVPGDTLDNYPTHYNSLGKGGFKIVMEISDRDLIPSERREEGMEVKVINGGLRFELVGGITNSDWVAIASNDVISNSLINYLISVNSIVVNGNLVTYGRVKASIEGDVYTSALTSNIFVPFAAAGLTRKDRIIITKDSLIERLPGQETLISLPQPLPSGTVSVDIVDVTDNSINSNPSDVDGAYVSKLSQGIFKITGSGDLSIFGIPLIKHIDLSGDITKIANIVISGNSFYNGFEIKLTNTQDTPIEFESAAGVKLVGEVNKILNPTETIVLRYMESDNSLLEIGQTSNVADNGDTIATKIDITLADLGVTTIAEVTDLMVTNHINGLGLVKSRKEFYVVLVEELRYIIADLPEGLVNITEANLLKFEGSGGIEPSVIFPDTKVFYTGSKSFTIEEGVKVLTFKKNGSTISIDWTQLGNVITYNGLEDLNTEDYFIYNGIKAVSIVEVSGDVPDATTTIKGKLKLAGDLGGTADNPTVPALANIYTKAEVNAKLSAVYISKGSVNTYSDLLALTGQEIGWVWNVKSEGKNYAWVGVSVDFPNGWDDIGGVFDVSGKEDKSNKTDNIALNKTSSEKYTSSKGVNDYIVSNDALFDTNLSGTKFRIKRPNGTFSAGVDITQSSVVGLTATLATKEDKSNKGIANGYAPLGADLKVPSANVSPLVGGVIFVSASGNNSTAEIENRDKPFLTIDAALTAYWANPKIDYIDIISADTFTATVALNDGATNRKIEIRSQKTCTLNINTDGVYSFVSTGGLLVQQQVFNLPFATLNFTPTTGARFGTHSITSPDVRINARNVSFGSLFNNSFSKATLIKIDADSITLNSTINGICDQTAVDIKVKILVFNGANCTLIGVQTWGNLDFEKITHNNTFKLNGDFSPLNINHGSIVGVAPYTNASFSYITVGGINVSYKQGAIITSNVNFNAFNATGNLVLKNEVSYPNSDYLIRGINVSNTIFITDSKITCKKLFGYRCSAKLVINNSYFTITSANFGATEMNNNSNTYESGTVTFEGTNYIIGATDGFNLYLESAEYTQLNKPSIDTTRGILRTNGLIDSAKIDLIDSVLNEY